MFFVKCDWGRVHSHALYYIFNKQEEKEYGNRILEWGRSGA